MTDFKSIERAVVFGANGGVGAALVEALSQLGHIETIHAVSRRPIISASPKVTSHTTDVFDEDSLATTANAIEQNGGVELVLVSLGLLSDDTGLQPERSYRHQTLPAFEQVFRVNTFGPALIAKHFLPLLPRKNRSVFAALSARVGSISDNRKGGWHAYRASKAALNMLLRNYALEMAANRKDMVVVGLHPGTVDTPLSKPFQRNVPEQQLFAPKESADYLLTVLSGLTPADSGNIIDWAGKQIPA